MHSRPDDIRRRWPRFRFCARLLMGCTALVALPMGALAQTAATENETTFRLSPIIVYAGAAADDDAASIVAQEMSVGGKVATSILDTPASVSVITQKEITIRDAGTTEEVLQYSAGIVTDYYGSDDRNDYFLLRGFQASTYRDGLTLGTMRGVREEPYAYERLEVLKGANSTLFGASDPGGSVNFVTKVPKFMRFGEVYGQAGSFDQAEVGFDFGDTLNEDETLAYRLTGKIRDSKLEYATSRDDEAFLMGGLSWRPTDDTTLSVVFDHLKRDGTPNSGGYPLDREYDRSNFYGEPDYNDHDVERSTLTALLQHDFGGGLTLRGNLRYSDLTDDFGYVYLTDSATRVGDIVERDYFGTDSTAEELIGNVILQYDTSFGSTDSSTLLGAEFRNASTSETSVYGDATPIDLSDPQYSGAPASLNVYSERDSNYDTRSVFIQQNLSFADRIIATFGARHDWLDLASKGQTFGTAFDDSDDFSETSFRGAVTYKVTDQISAYASYVESVAPPDIGVEPERGSQYELGVKYQPAGTNALISASVYDLTQDNVTVAVVQGDGSIERQVVGESRARGFEIEARAEIAASWDVVAAYAYTDTEVLRGPDTGPDVTGNQFATVPEHLASVWVTYTMPSQGSLGDMTFGLGARHVGSYYYTLANDTGMSEATTLLDAAFTYDLAENTGLSVNVSNLLDNQHVVGSGTADYYNPGRTISATLRRTW
ncbi:TonB-dependent siderophore receptor [Frigidibacter albus]|uniref:TonB-dependent siderophore receptor n=1 Tax=Frigidibacter albus TaxID=1465486 RepID=A0A6L8VEE3_9RHOB|nr:TonB-dependent siderophore receptor [Frigidibacter albus]MZQ87610.1 TonB-dependent siderophore receptor [Frigidibacter albus]NBE29516.1 TonB-dependent siderophore receptor [Frigidibacter albus]GGH44368.1 ligand-gated channel [Frigidibacter albus]